MDPAVPAPAAPTDLADDQAPAHGLAETGELTLEGVKDYFDLKEEAAEKALQQRKIGQLSRARSRDVAMRADKVKKNKEKLEELKDLFRLKQEYGNNPPSIWSGETLYTGDEWNRTGSLSDIAGYHNRLKKETDALEAELKETEKFYAGLDPLDETVFGEEVEGASDAQ